MTRYWTSLRAIWAGVVERGKYALVAQAIIFSAIGLVWLGSDLYYRLAPGDWFIRYYSVDVAPAVEGEEVPVTLCRHRNVTDVKATLTRTFYRGTVEGSSVSFKSVGQYTSPLTIEGGKECTTVAIKPERFSHEAGTWRFHTDVSFKVNGHGKTTSYDSPTYVITAKPTNEQLQDQLEQQIEDLQNQLDELRARIRADSTTPATTADRTEPTAQTQQPTTSEPPQEQPQPPSAPPRQPNLVEQVVGGIGDGLSGLLSIFGRR